MGRGGLWAKDLREVELRKGVDGVGGILRGGNGDSGDDDFMDFVGNGGLGGCNPVPRRYVCTQTMYATFHQNTRGRRGMMSMLLHHHK